MFSVCLFTGGTPSIVSYSAGWYSVRYSGGGYLPVSGLGGWGYLPVPGLGGRGYLPVPGLGGRGYLPVSGPGGGVWGVPSSTRSGGGVCM